MPVQRNSDQYGSYYQWGKTGRKYRYIVGNAKSRMNAQQKASAQGRAIKANGGRLPKKRRGFNKISVQLKSP